MEEGNFPFKVFFSDQVSVQESHYSDQKFFSARLTQVDAKEIN